MSEKEEVIRLNRTQNAVRNIVFGLVNKIVTLICPFIIRTLIIKILGMQYAGLDGLFVSILEVLNLSELGLSSAIVYCMYKPIARGDDDSVCALLKLFRKMYLWIGMFVLIIGVAIMPFLKFFIKDSYPADINLYVLYFIYLINSCASYFFMGYRSAILSAYQRIDIIQNVSTLIKMAMYITQIIILAVCRNFYAYAVMLPLFTILINILTAYESRRIFPQYKCKGNVSSTEKKDLKEKVSGLMITKLCSVTRNSFDSIFISAFIGLTVAAVYTNYYFIMKSIIAVLGIIIQAVLAGVGNSIETESIDQNYNDLKRFNFMYLWISGVCTVCLLCLYQPFMVLWMGQNNLLPMSSVILFCMYFYLLKMGDMQSVYYNAAGLWWNYRLYTIIEAVLNLILNYILVQKWGLNGVIAGTLISLFLINFLCCERIVFKYYFKNGKTVEFYLKQIRYAITTAAMCAIVYVVCDYTEEICRIDATFMILILRIGVCILFPNFIYYIVYKNTSECKSAFEWLKSKIGKWYRK